MTLRELHIINQALIRQTDLDVRRREIILRDIEMHIVEDQIESKIQRVIYD